MADLLDTLDGATIQDMTRRKSDGGAKVPQEAVRLIGLELKRRRSNYENQEELGAAYGISQAQVSRFIGTVRDEEPKPYWPGPDVVASLASKLGLEYEGPRIGMRRASDLEVGDMIPNRGRALDTLSDEYSTELLAEMRAHPAPAGHEKWTYVRWLEYFIKLKSLMDTGSSTAHRDI